MDDRTGREKGGAEGEDLTRRALLRTATASGAVMTAAGLAGVSSARADLAADGYGAPLAEIHVPAGVSRSSKET